VVNCTGGSPKGQSHLRQAPGRGLRRRRAAV
jgi:hypothetical protein